MNITRIVLFFTLLTIFSCQSPTKTEEPSHYTVHVNLENAPFDSLYLRDYTDGRDLLFTGKKTKEYTWEISIPDSIAEDSERMELWSSQYDSISNSVRTVRFVTEKKGKQIFLANIGVEDRDNYIKGEYIREVSFPGGFILEIDGSDIDVDLYTEDFKLIIEDEQSDIAARAEDPYNSWFADFVGEGLTYDDFFKSYEEIAKKHPNSRFIMASLAANLNNYKSKDDVRTIYGSLSDKHKNSIWSTNIERYLSGKFENTSLPTMNGNAEEDVVQDYSKYNLIVFSASWCAPCIDEIPLLKEICQDLNKNLILTFVSMDESKTVPAFQKLIQEESIPWRTLFGHQDIRGITQKYAISGIPHNILVHPNGDMDILDVRNDDDRAKLYSLF